MFIRAALHSIKNNHKKSTFVEKMLILKLNLKRERKNLKALIYSSVNVKHLRLRTMSSMTSPPQRTLG